MIQIKHDSIRFFFLSHIKSIHPKVISTKLNKSADLKKVCWEASRAAPWIVEAICFKHFSKIRLYAWWKNCPGLWVCVCVCVCVCASTSSWPKAEGDKLLSSRSTQVQFNSVSDNAESFVIFMLALSVKKLQHPPWASRSYAQGGSHGYGAVGREPLPTAPWGSGLVNPNMAERGPGGLPCCGGLVTVATQETIDKIPDKKNTAVHCHRAGHLPGQGDQLIGSLDSFVLMRSRLGAWWQRLISQLCWQIR